LYGPFKNVCYLLLIGTKRKKTRGSVIPSTRQVTLTSGTPQSRTDHDFGDVKTDTGIIGDGLPTDFYIYACGKCCTQFMLPMEKSGTFTGACTNEIILNG
jgi:hypothetical protein